MVTSVIMYFCYHANKNNIMRSYDGNMNSILLFTLFPWYTCYHEYFAHWIPKAIQTNREFLGFFIEWKLYSQVCLAIDRHGFYKKCSNQITIKYKDLCKRFYKAATRVSLSVFARF